MKKFLKAAKLTGIAVTASFAIIAVIYLLETKAVAGGAQYEAVTAEYTSVATSTEEMQTEATTTAEHKTTEAVTEAQTVKATEAATVKATEAATEVQTVKATEAATVKATEAATEAPKAVQPATEAATEAAAKAQTATPVKAEVKAPAFTDVTYKDGNGTSHTYATLDEAKAAINVPVLSDAQAKAAAKANKTTYSAQAKEVVDLINAYRTANGLSAVANNDTLAAAAMHRAAESAYSDWNMTAMENGAKRHIRPNFTKASTIADEYGITGNFGENFGRWQTSASEIVSDWKASSSHNALLLGAEYTKIGVGIAQDSLGDYYWVAIFN